ncbi:RNA-binding domain-containing protein [Acidaminobacter sp. JC074]|uniref:RNA-binding domain-containing protein n=1 Tax=Acidaminobacter sp. JC074 TaxID=2530199 RepID=UPI00210320FF|nr:RNA-binding domain-containing protein [Acidaminobacter sp. JC074]
MFAEDLNNEFKRKYVKELAKTVVAFANTNGGKIFLGIDDSGDIVGLDKPDDELLKLTNTIRDSISPDVTPFISSKFENYDDKKVIVCSVQKGSACPYYLTSKGLRPEGVYVRQGASSVPASQSTILKMIKETDGDSYEELRSLNQELTFNYLKSEFEKNDLYFEEPQKKTLGIIGDDGLYTNLALLLSDQCNHSIKAAVFEGTSKNHFLDRYEFEGSVMKQMREVYAFVDRYNRTQSRFEGIDRIDLREYPEEALREALLNSIVHKDYGFGASTLVSVFDDRIEILTIGGLVKGLTKNDIMIGTSLLRNRKLANVFYRIKWIEAYGTGILKIKEAYDDYKSKPDITITDNAFKVTLPAIKLLDKEAKKSLSLSEQKVLDMLSSSEYVKRSEVQRVLEISQPMAVKVIRGLLDKEVIEKVGSGKNVVYKLSDEM